ncbi:putative Diguanylate cyclase [uncultured Defluviicoccus sp.]|uniref:Putative Diguanylate cyclase n=1 Tax=metagenome TaxID=256318 RepID=A0A380TCW4_9ZZZZ|nr:putative Diguanylate cyclase [uncultured Defluviicoccus sp.]SUS05320.1 putative Diguanylate cyclase [uncultured Defluviicoccus sp.]
MTSVVIVDDQAVNLKILCRFAQSLESGIDVKAFGDPAQALTAVGQGNIDLIVSDYVMPGLNGAEFIRRCRQLTRDDELPIIVVTAFEDREYRYRALEAGASDFLLSPVDGQEFCTRARNLLSLWRHRQMLRQRANTLESELASALRQHAEEIRLREEHLRRVVNTVPALIRSCDPAGRMVLINSCHQKYFDLDGGADRGATREALLGEDYARKDRQLDDEVLKTGAMVVGIEETVHDRNGRERVLLTTKAPLRLGEGDIGEIVTVSLDITNRKRVERQVRESENRFRSLVEGSVLGIVIEQGDAPVFANSTAARIFGYLEPDGILALKSFESLFAPNEGRRIRRLKRSGVWSHTPAEPREFQGLRKDEGSLIWVELLTQEVRWRGAPAYLSTVADISLRKAYEERLHRQANIDEVTALPNRTLALDRLRRAVGGAVRHRHKGGVLFIDLDHFKKVNDTWGHAIGDELLRLAAGRLRECVRAEDTVARLGGDEFIIILPDIPDASHAAPVIRKILTAFSEPFVLDRHQVFVTSSIGVAIFPDDSDEPASLIQNADAAMYLAKQKGRNTFHYFTPQVNEHAIERMRIEGQLVHAVSRNEFVLHYQPIIDISSGLLSGAEALLRWHNTELGALDPEVFVPVAEDTGLIVPIGQWVLDQACKELRRFHNTGLPHLCVSVNVSLRQLRGVELIGTVADVLKRHGTPAARIELEITEGCLMHDITQVGRQLQALHGLGVRLGLDDFGTGFSCLSHLKMLPVDTAKIDKSFIKNASDNPGDASIVEAIIAMAHSLGIRVVAEGVENGAQLSFLAQRHCDCVQGNYFSVPLPADEFIAWARAWSPRVSAPAAPSGRADTSLSDCPAASSGS